MLVRKVHTKWGHGSYCTYESITDQPLGVLFGVDSLKMYQQKTMTSDAQKTEKEFRMYVNRAR